jgi:L-lactate dehydrogenase
MVAPRRYLAAPLMKIASDLLVAAGLEPDIAGVVADTLIQADLMGHDTHGLALLAPYLREIDNCAMTTSGEPVVVSDRPGALLWDGQRLPGPWLLHLGLLALMPRAKACGTASLVIRRSHHIACLAVYLEHAAEAGFVVTLASSDPQVASVAPHGGTVPVMTPNPIGYGFPTSNTPILVDVSASLVTNGISARLQKAGKQFEEQCLLDASGLPSRDPAVLSAEPKGSILPLGGLAFGHKGFGLGIAVEGLTAGLAGVGRADPKEGWGATVFLSLHDPEAFGGLENLKRQTDWLGDSCRSNPPRPGVSAVRMPGDRAAERKHQQYITGIELHDSIAPSLSPYLERYSIDLSTALAP